MLACQLHGRQDGHLEGCCESRASKGGFSADGRQLFQRLGPCSMIRVLQPGEGVGGRVDRRCDRVCDVRAESVEAQWYEREVQSLLDSASKEQRSAIEIEVYLTGSREDFDDSKAAGQFLRHLDEPEKAPDVQPVREMYDSSDSASLEDSQPSYTVQHLRTRPDLPSIIQQEASSISPETPLGVFVSQSMSSFASSC